MTAPTVGKRMDSASRRVAATPRAVWRAFIDPLALISWLPPQGMRGEVEAFDPRPGGVFRLTLTYVAPDGAAPGKTSDHADTVDGRFVELVPDERIVWAVAFVSDDPAFSGEMTMEWTFAPTPCGTEVAVCCRNVPEGIRKEDHDQGLRSTLQNLSAFLE